MPASPFKVTEAKIEKKVVAFCRKAGLYCRKFASPSNAGVPDRVIVGARGTLFLELKRPGNKPTPLQMAEMQKIRESGGHAGWSDSVEVSAHAALHYCAGKPQHMTQSTENLKFLNLVPAVRDSEKI
jgi:hypothetical protein